MSENENKLVPVLSEGWTLHRGEGGCWISDLELANRLGLARPRNIRVVIQKAAKEGLLIIARMRAMVSDDQAVALAQKTLVEIGSGAHREVTEYYLNEEAALLLIMRSRTPRMIDLRRQLSRAFLAVVRGEFTAREARLAIEAKADLAYAEAERFKVETQRLAAEGAVWDGKVKLTSNLLRAVDAAGALAGTGAAKLQREFLTAVLSIAKQNPALPKATEEEIAQAKILVPSSAAKLAAVEAQERKARAETAQPPMEALNEQPEGLRGLPSIPHWMAIRSPGATLPSSLPSSGSLTVPEGRFSDGLVTPTALARYYGITKQAVGIVISWIEEKHGVTLRTDSNLAKRFVAPAGDQEREVYALTALGTQTFAHYLEKYLREEESTLVWKGLRKEFRDALLNVS